MFKPTKYKNILIAGELTSKRSTLKVLPQKGKLADFIRDSSRVAQLPGKRISKTGKVYWETRRNRSDAAGKRL